MARVTFLKSPAIGGQRGSCGRRLAAMLLPVGVVLAAACQNDGLHPPSPLDESQLYWTLDLNHRAVTLSTTPPYDTLTLVATPRTPTDAPLAGTFVVQYVSSDPERVAVTPEGVVRALQAGPQIVAVVATLTMGNLKSVDTAIVRVMDRPAPPVLSRFSIHPVPPDSAKAAAATSSTCFNLPTSAESRFRVAFSCSHVIPVVVEDAAGAPIDSVLVKIRSSDPKHVAVDPGGLSLTPVGITAVAYIPPRTVSLYASTTVFGLRKADTLPFRTGWPAFNALDLGGGLGFPADVKIGVGGFINWQNLNPAGLGSGVTRLDITFTDPTNVAAVDTAQVRSLLGPLWTRIFCGDPTACDGGGNILVDPIPQSQFFHRVRRFPVAGVYEYYSTSLGAGGRIVVIDDR